MVDGYAQLLASRGRGLEPAAVEAQARRILSASAQLTHLVQDLLDFARLEHGEIAVHPHDVDLAPVLRETLADLRRRPGGERLVADLPAQLPARADPVRVAQVVANLLDNALKYAPEGPVRLRGWAVADGAAPGIVRVEVVDQGPGVPAGEQARIWEKFFRGAGVAELHAAAAAASAWRWSRPWSKRRTGGSGWRAPRARGAASGSSCPRPARPEARQRSDRKRSDRRATADRKGSDRTGRRICAGTGRVTMGVSGGGSAVCAGAAG